MKLVAYLRVSTERQAEEGLGLDVQRQAIKAWAKAEGHRITLWTADEGISGSNGLDTRVGLVDTLGAVQAGTVGGIVVYRLDRLARDLVLQESLLAEVWRSGGQVFSTSAAEAGTLAPDDPDDPTRTLIRQLLGALAQWERATIRLRMRAGKARKAEQGGYTGGAPALGWRAEGRELVEDHGEQTVRARILALRAEGLSLREIGAVLEDEGLRPKRGGAWHPEKVRAVLSRG